MLSGVTRHMLPHLPGVPHLHAETAPNTDEFFNPRFMYTRLIRTVCFVPGERKSLNFL